MNQDLETRPAVRPFQPETFGSFTLLAPLGAGGMGEVFLARSTFQGGLDRLCVIKRILPRLANDPEFVTRFQDEVRTLLKLQHGSIAQVYDAGSFDGDYWISLEFVDGKDLRRLLQRLRQVGERLPIELAVYVAVKVLEALAYAHRRKDDAGREIGLVHRDVSPQNILLSYEGEVKVIDFGLAESKLSTAKNPAQMVLGKIHYMAPEQARGDFVDRRSDLYAMGVVLWEMLIGKNPFEEIPPDEILQHIRDPSLPPIQSVDPSLPKAVAAVVDRALSPEPFRRFATAEEMRSRLSACLSEMAPDAGPEPLGKWLTHLFRDEFERERELLARLATRGEVLTFDPEGETQMVPIVEDPLGPHGGATEVFYASSSSLPWPNRPYLPESEPSVPVRTTEPKKRSRLWLGLPLLPLVAGLGWWLGRAEAPPPVQEPAPPPVEAIPEPVAEPIPVPREPAPTLAPPIEAVEPMGPPLPAPAAEPPPRPRVEARAPSRPPPSPEPVDEVAEQRAQLLASWRSLQARYRQLVETHGEDRVGTIVGQLVHAAETSVNRFIDQPGEYGTLEAQLETLSALVKEREDALR